LTHRHEDLERIRQALLGAADVVRGHDRATVGVTYKEGDSPVTDADLAVDRWLRRTLPTRDEGWLSEESTDDRARLEHRRVWIVDPIDGTREFLDGIPEWSVSIALAEDGIAVAGGIYNPTAGELFLGALETGVTLNGEVVRASGRDRLEDALVLVPRWALRKKTTPPGPFAVRAVGPIAYTLALVAAGHADATWNRSPKAEWDVAAGVALVAAAGGHVSTWDWGPIVFNRWPPHAPGIVVCAPGLRWPLQQLLGSGAARGRQT
jgi:myo-inositol-1(or 4)-monophosphatase